MIRSIAALALCLGLALAPAAARAEGQVAPDFTLRDIENKEVKLSEFKGKVVVMSFWATWCQPCKAEMPHLQKMLDELGSKGLVVLSVSIDDARASSQVKPYIKQNQFTFPVLLDKETTVVSQYNPDKTVPFAVVIGRDGKVIQVHRGYNPGDEKKLREEVLAALAAAG